MLEQHTARPTIVSFLLDRTGSMEAIKDETIGGFNAYLDTLEREAGELIAFTLLQFDSQSIDTLYAGVKLSEVQRLTPEAYQPRAYTPLTDACFKTIKAAEETIATRRDKPRVIVVFQTDGEENASREHTLDELRALIERRKTEDWQFVFLGADIDAYTTARSFGILDESDRRLQRQAQQGGVAGGCQRVRRFRAGPSRACPIHRQAKARCWRSPGEGRRTQPGRTIGVVTTWGV